MNEVRTLGLGLLLTLCPGACGGSDDEGGATGSSSVGSGEDTAADGTAGSGGVELPGCAAGQSRLTTHFIFTELSPGASAQSEHLDPLLDAPFDVVVCVDSTEDSNAEPLQVDFVSDGTTEWFGPGASMLSDEATASLASVSRIDWQVLYQESEEPQILNFNVWGDDPLPRWLLHISCSEFTGPQVVDGEVQLAPIECSLAGARLTRSDAAGSLWAEGLGDFQLEP